MDLKKTLRGFVTKSLVFGAFLGLFALGLPLVSAAVLPTGGTVNNQAPTLGTVSDGGSDATAPTYAGDNVTFTTTATDPNGEKYYLAICKTNAITPGNNSNAPTCPGTAWAISLETNSGAQASVTYPSVYGDGTRNWWAFTCDKVASGGALCSGTTGNQGSGVTGSPFVVDDHAPITSIAPNDGSTDASPTNAGNIVTFTGTATDARGDQYYMAACKTQYIKPMSNAAPQCCSDAGLGTCDTSFPTTHAYTWAVSAAFNSGSGATATYTTVTGDAENNPWYVYFCDKNTVAGGGKCSTPAQTANSPFVVNHVPSMSAPVMPSINPGANATFQVTTADSDIYTVQDTVAMYVCTNATTAFDGTNCTGGTLLCSSTPANPGVASCTTSSSPMPIPAAHASIGVKLYMKDSHGFYSAANPQNYTVNDVAPSITDPSAYCGGVACTTISPIAGGSTSPSYTVVITDNNGDNDITATTAVLYDSGAGSLTAGTCTADENKCYPGVTCTLSANSDYTAPGVGGAAASNATATCAWSGANAIWFNANASATWKMHANPTDQANAPTGLTESGAFSVSAILAAVSIAESSIAYGSLALGADSNAQTTAMQNQGNTIIDVLVQGTDMTSGANTIPLAQQHFNQTTSTWTWGTGDFTLVSTAQTVPGSCTGGVCDGDDGCLNRELAVRLVHVPNRCENGTTACTVATQTTDCAGIGTQTCNKNALDEAIYWKLRIPSNQASGSYSGTTTFSTTANTTCNGTAY